MPVAPAATSPWQPWAFGFTSVFRRAHKLATRRVLVQVPKQLPSLHTPFPTNARRLVPPAPPRLCSGDAVRAECEEHEGSAEEELARRRLSRGGVGGVVARLQEGGKARERVEKGRATHTEVRGAAARLRDTTAQCGRGGGP